MLEVLLSAFEKFMRWVRGIEANPAPYPGHIPPHPMPPPAPPMVAPIIEPAGTQVPAPAPASSPVPSEPEPTREKPAASANAAPKRRARNFKSNEDKETLAYLLDNLELSFRALSIASELGSNVCGSDRAGLKRLGPFIPPREWIRRPDSRHIEDIENARFSSLIFIALNTGHQSSAEKMHPDFFYAIQETSPPPGVQRLPGRQYQCGFAWRAVKSKGRLVWLSFHCSIDESTGLVTAANELHRQRVSLPKGDSYVRNVSRLPHIGTRGEDDEELDPAAEFAHHFNMWERRKTLWSVSARRLGRRVTFGIDPNSAVSFFKDRGHEAITPNGQRKRILHAVNEHTRANGTPVKAHIRGAEKFLWNGFDCAITAPEHVYQATEFGLPGSNIDELRAARTQPKGLVTMVGLAHLLAETEDNNVKAGQRKSKLHEMESHTNALVSEISQPFDVGVRLVEQEEKREVDEFLRLVKTNGIPNLGIPALPDVPFEPEEHAQAGGR